MRLASIFIMLTFTLVTAAQDVTTETKATRESWRTWLPIMLNDYQYTLDEAAGVLGWSTEEVEIKRGQLDQTAPAALDAMRVLPYPGGRHPRIGFLEGAVDPMRGTKAGVFIPGSTAYFVIDLPEAVWHQNGLLFLAHTHIPTIWDQRGEKIINHDWIRKSEDQLENVWTLPNGVMLMAGLFPPSHQMEEDGESWSVGMRLAFHNLSDEKMSDLVTQVCIMLKGAPQFNALTNENKIFDKPVAAVHSSAGDEWIITAWNHCDRAWGNADVPCLHSDPQFANCPAGDSVYVQGEAVYYRGADPHAVIERLKTKYQ
ncbi:MAG: hypothetical protein GC154_00095 [bacterium]|nr:hypothetical protein [bacterium]